MNIKIIRKNRRKQDRRQHTDTNYPGPERRSGKDRRKLDEKLQRLLEENEKKQSVADRLNSRSGTGNIIRRRKNKGDERI